VQVEEEPVTQQIDRSKIDFELASVDIKDLFNGIAKAKNVIPNKIISELNNQGVPKKKWASTVFPGNISNKIKQGGLGTIYGVLRSATAHIKKLYEYRNEEKRHRRGRTNMANNNTDAEYSGPLYIYAHRSKKISRDTLIERRSPINTGVSKNALKKVKSNTRKNKINDAVYTADYMTNNLGWQRPKRASTRAFIIPSHVSKTGLKTQNEQVINKTGKIPTARWDLRIFNISDQIDSNVSIVGQAHHDPPFHGLLSKDWKFKDSREKVKNSWESNGYNSDKLSFGNSVGNSSHGKFSQITN
jgi:hypothetical protein